MRTTVTLEQDVADRLHEYAHQRRISFKQALNELIRQGLGAQQGVRGRKRFKVKPHRGGFRAGVDPSRLNQLVDELEVQDFVRETQKP